MRFYHDDRKVESKAPCMKVIGAGLSRCATSSLQAALESDILGFDPCIHMAHIVPHSDREALVIEALQEQDKEKRQKILHKIFDGYKATADFPGWIFADDLMDMYPDAVVVLNKRENGQVWAKSIGNSLHFFGTLWYCIPTFLWTTDRLHYWIHRSAYEMAHRRFKSVNLYTPEFYDLHNAWVRTEAKKRGVEVIEWSPADQWAPLCKALGKEEPKDKRPFPRLNEASQMAMVKRILVTRGLVSWAVLGGTVWASWKYGPSLWSTLLAKLS